MTAATPRVLGRAIAPTPRLDWRFLLDDPELGPTLLLGAQEPGLREVIEAAGGRLLTLGDPTAAGPIRTVVGRDPIAAGDLARAVRRLGPDGRVVLRVDGVSAPLVGRAPGGPGRATRIRRQLRAAGCGQVDAWLVWPSHERGLMAASLDDPVGLSALVRRRAGVDGEAQASGPRAIVRAGIDRIARSPGARTIMEAVAPAITIVASRAPEGSTRAPGRPPPGGVLGRWLADASPAATPTGLVVLTPGYGASAHVVAIRVGGDGAVRSVAKVPRHPEDPGIHHEAEVLRAVASTLGVTGRAPVVLHDPTRHEGWPVLVESGLAGPPLDPARVRGDRDAAARAVVDLLEAMPVRPASDRARPVSDRVGAALDRIASLEGGPGDVLLDLVVRSRPVLEVLAGADLPVVVEHGDPAHPNLIVGSGGVLGAVDWERGELDGLPLHDLTLALAYLAGADARASTPPALAAAFGAGLAGSDGWVAAALDADCQRLGVDPGARPALVVSAFARTAAWLVDRLRRDGRTDADVVRWLLADRVVALWRVALDAAEAR